MGSLLERRLIGSSGVALLHTTNRRPRRCALQDKKMRVAQPVLCFSRLDHVLAATSPQAPVFLKVLQGPTTYHFLHSVDLGGGLVGFLRFYVVTPHPQEQAAKGWGVS